MPAGVGRIRYYDESMEKPQITRKMLARILEYFIPYWKQMLVAVAAILISSVLGLAPSIFIKNIVDQALPHRDLKLLGLLIAISVLITILLGLLQVYQTYLNNWIAMTYHFTDEKPDVSAVAAYVAELLLFCHAGRDHHQADQRYRWHSGHLQHDSRQRPEQYFCAGRHRRRPDLDELEAGHPRHVSSSPCILSPPVESVRRDGRSPPRARKKSVN